MKSKNTPEEGKIVTNDFLAYRPKAGNLSLQTHIPAIFTQPSHPTFTVERFKTDR